MRVAAGIGLGTLGILGIILVTNLSDIINRFTKAPPVALPVGHEASAKGAAALPAHSVRPSRSLPGNGTSAAEDGPRREWGSYRFGQLHLDLPAPPQRVGGAGPPDRAKQEAQWALFEAHSEACAVTLSLGVLPPSMPGDGLLEHSAAKAIEDIKKGPEGDRWDGGSVPFTVRGRDALRTCLRLKGSTDYFDYYHLLDGNVLIGVAVAGVEAEAGPLGERIVRSIRFDEDQNLKSVAETKADAKKVRGRAPGADTPGFTTVRLPYGVEIRTPRNWRMRGGHFIGGRPVTGAEFLEHVPIGPPGPDEVTLLFASAKPLLVSPSIRVSVKKAIISEEQLWAATARDLQELGSGFRKGFQANLDRSGKRITSFQPLKVAEVDGYPVCRSNGRKQAQRTPT